MNINLIFIVLTLIIGIFIGAIIIYLLDFIKVNNARAQAEKLLSDAKNEADKYKRDIMLETKEESFKIKQEIEQANKIKKQKLKENEDRLLQREKTQDKRDEMLQKRDALLDDRDNNLLAKQKELQEKEVKIDEILKNEIDKLEKIGKISCDEAHKMIMDKVERDMSTEIANFIKEKESEAKLIAKEKAKDLIISSMQRYSEDVTSEQTVSTINLPSDEMKGRLIGREGRNIRAIESVTGVDLIIDDTPEAIVISSFDPLRRELAKITIETLIKDGRIHPSRIEEIYNKVENDMNSKITEIGNETLFNLGINNIDPELVYLIGKLHFRTSYGQNALQHSIEVANLTGLMAGEVGENVLLAKRAGLLHDIGKAIDYDVEGSHVEIGVDIAKKYHEDEIVINTIASHHHDDEQNSVIAVLVEIADTLSAARPGARNDTLENYIKRLEQLEDIASSFDGVEKTFAMQAGREVRVMVKPEEVNDANSYKIARDIKKRIEEEMQYPGTIKITVIRETRVQEEAR